MQPDNGPITGTFLMNRTKIEYLLDGGADETIINEAAFSRILKYEPDTKISPYDGSLFYSCSSEIEVKGQLTLNQCIIALLWELALRSL